MDVIKISSRACGDNERRAHQYNGSAWWKSGNVQSQQLSAQHCARRMEITVGGFFKGGALKS